MSLELDHQLKTALLIQHLEDEYIDLDYQL